MSVQHLATDILWVVPLILQGAIALVMVRRKIVRSFPFFFSYTTAILSTNLVLIFLPYNHRAYSLIYWWSEALAILLGLAVIFEILRRILPSSPAGQFVLNVVRVLAGVAAITALVILVSSKPGLERDRVLEDIVFAERSLRFLQASLLIVVIALMSLLGLTWQDESLGILAGFGVYSVLALVVYEFGYHLHVMSTTAYLLLNSAGYNVAVLIWAFYLLRPRRRPPLGRFPDGDLAEWADALNNYVSQRSPRR